MKQHRNLLLSLVAAAAVAAAGATSASALSTRAADVVGVSGSYAVHVVTSPGDDAACVGLNAPPVGWWAYLNGTLVASGTTTEAPECWGTPTGYMLTYHQTYDSPTAIERPYDLVMDMGAPDTFAGSASAEALPPPPAVTTTPAPTAPTVTAPTISSPTDAPATTSPDVSALEARVAALEAEIAALTARVDRLVLAGDAADLAFQQALADGSDVAAAAETARGTWLDAVYGLGAFAG